MVAGDNLTLSLNRSVHSLHDLNFPDQLVSIAVASGISPERITIEITESGVVSDIHSALDVLTRLRMKRIGLSIDDFGTGYSMMEQLRNVPATELKIDRTFVANMATDSNSRVMVEKTIELGHELDMTIVAEGVETREQLRLLTDKGCDAGQGYLFCRPLPVLALIEWLPDGRLWI
jgi:EAL domain-containing protein (putative c-di-GMP-specific phosphodiesterase class I)